jgi:hypothetical protein
VAGVAARTNGVAGVVGGRRPVAGLVGGRRPVAGVVGGRQPVAGWRPKPAAEPSCCRVEWGFFLQWAQPVRHVKVDGDGVQAYL